VQIPGTGADDDVDGIGMGDDRSSGTGIDRSSPSTG
jgi:hypothetical protein